MPMRLNGLVSGMDTESIIKELVNAKRVKVDDAKRAQTKLGWKQDAWKSLNSRLVKLYNNSLNSMRFESGFIKKTTKVSNPNLMSVIAGEDAANSVQNVKIRELARPGYMTGKQLSTSPKYNNDTILTASQTDGGFGIAAGSVVEVNVDGKSTQITIGADTTIKSFTKSLQDAGIHASFDTKNQRFYISSKETGELQDFTLVGVNGDGNTALQSLGISSYDADAQARYQAIIDNQEDTKTSRQTTRLNGLTSQLNSLESAQIIMMKHITDNYADEFADVDTTDPEAIKAKIASMDQDSDVYNALKNWGTDYDDIVTKLADINSKLTRSTSTDGDGNEVITYELTPAVKDEINQQVEAEAAYARQALLDIANGVLGSTAANKSTGTDARIELNGVTYLSSTNTFEINGLTMTVNAQTTGEEEVTITTMDDTEGVYDMIKGFLKEYNSIINEMDKLYNADSIRGIEPLTKEEKEALSDSEIEEWEKKIKDSILRRDPTMNTMSSALKNIMASGVKVGGNKMYLSDFGIETLSYFIAPEDEKNAYHINNDKDDDYTSGNADKLKGMISSDPDTVVSFFNQLSKNMYSKMTDLMKGTEYSSSYTAYDDKKMQQEYKDYTTKIKELEKKLADYEDMWYAKFASMETAMAKMQKNASAVTSLLGGS